MRSVYFSLFHSHLSYASEVWGQKLPPNSRIFILQKQAMRHLTFSNFDAHSKPLFKQLNILTLSDLIFLSNASLIHQTINSITPLAIQHTFNLNQLPQTHVTRRQNAKHLTTPSVRTTKFGLNSVRFQAITNWNTLLMHFKDIDLTSVSKSKLKSLVSKFLMSSYLN